MTGAIRLNDGTVFNGNAMQDGDTLWLDLVGVTFEQACTKLLDAENTEKIIAMQYGTSFQYDGYTYLFMLRESTGLKVAAGLEKR